MTINSLLKNYLIDFDTTNCFRATLTLEQRVDHKSIDNYISAQNIKHFINTLNKKCFGNSFKRFNR